MGLILVLIVDDDPALLQALSEALHLRIEGLKIAAAESAIIALEEITATDYDVVITDITMPGMDGLALLSKIKELRPETPTLLITGHGDQDLTVQALRGGAYDYLQKPIDREYLVASLKRAIQTRQLSRQVEAQRRALEQHAAVLEQIVQERTRDLLEANQTQEAFISIASHELLTPVTTLKLLTQMERRKLERDGHSLAPSLVRREQAIARMEQLIHDLLDVSRIEAGKLAMRPKPCLVQALCQQVVEEQTIATNRVITLTAPHDPVEIEVDGERISQVLTNLLSNALKYSPATTPVTLTIEQAGEQVLLGVRDQGPGIPTEALPHLFDRFYRVPGIEVQSGSGIGLGLGLYICREIVEQHSGQIWAESIEGCGSTFFVALPLAGSSAAEPLNASPPGGEQSKSTSSQVLSKRGTKRSAQ